jgi:hypothetical protein
VRYMLLLYVSGRPTAGTPEAAEVLPLYRAYTDELRERGVLLGVDALHGPDSATTVRVRDGEALNTDGPFAETTEWLGGYYVLDCADLDEALALAARCPTASRGSVEVRPIIELPA